MFTTWFRTSQDKERIQAGVQSIRLEDKSHLSALSALDVTLFCCICLDWNIGLEMFKYTNSGGSSRFKSRGGTSKLKCFIFYSEDHVKRDCPMKKSSGFVKKAKHDQVSDSSDDEGNAYFREVLVVVGNDEMTELVMDLGGSYHMTHKRDFLYDFKGFDGGSVPRYQLPQ
ncbi:hypothetical protein Tco_0938619 [Tanacetum coccineum]|uniref:Uncharacterized protein n=1 Tax=Tanacetum coccineum TaxID=301880 RepID=A0ABQ5DPP3_9ASTR